MNICWICIFTFVGKLYRSLNKFRTNCLFEMFCDAILGKKHIEPETITGISFCIPTHGKRREKTLLTLKSIQKEMADFPHEIIICGNIEQFEASKGTTLLEDTDSANTGKVAVLRNKAASCAKFNTIAWCDDDIILGKGWLNNTLEFSKKEGWFVLGNKIFNPDGTRHWDRATLNPHKLVDYETPIYANYIQTAGFFLMRKSIHNTIKWNEETIVFSDKTGGIPEDVALSLELNKLNIPVTFNKESHVWHNDTNYTQIDDLTLNLQDAKKLLKVDLEPYVCDMFSSLQKLLSKGVA